MDDDVGENLVPNITNEKKTLQGILSESLALLEKLEKDLIKCRNSREKTISTDDITNNQQQRPFSPNRFAPFLDKLNLNQNASKVLENVQI